ncbi:TetR family transcriptional regulator (plasmid) [Sodalis praecaptivus]|uniref:TetR family transcriptional regulator n=1 Tax=Sodalis praecaptivus TaxID=1239307 RepID=W0HZF7_9GAMM|nr:TetR/AcrR family transcriptional regulator [Sodalis praecaptivus]AHF79221.1 TetR family transcriptional regulator [Sodalis praecaptivus]
MKKTTSDTREKILNTAEQLIAQLGIQATSMDLLVKTSGVARKSIYRYFPTKDDVAAAALTARDARWLAWFRAATETANTPQLRLLAMFDALSLWFQSVDFRGCVFINTAGEIGDADAPLRVISKRHKQKLLAYIHHLCEQTPCPQPARLARQLLLLIEGAITLARVMGALDAANIAKDTARTLLAQACPPPAD